MKNLSIFFTNKRAFSLLEAIISIAIFAIFATAIYTSIQYIYKVIYSSRIEIIETDILNEQVELIRNMNFADVGIVSSTPAGILSRNVLVTRNNIDFLITRSIRSVDSPADGTIDTGTDIDPNDYKLVFLEVQCVYCLQFAPLYMSTYLADSFPEDTSNSGALFVNVKDSLNNPIKDVTVHVVSNDPSINIDITDTTNNSGQLRIYNLPICYKCYEVTVSKNGFNSDNTYSSVDLGGATPVNEHITINDQQVSNSYFQIATPAQLTINTVNMECLPVSGVSFSVSGGGTIANNPDVEYFQDTVSTDGNGGYNFGNLRWGNYNFTINSNYNFVGSSPSLPLNILANSNQSIKIVLATSTAHSLSLLVRDRGTQLPVSNALVTLNSGGVESTNYTGLGYIKQDNWSGLASHEFFDGQYGFWSASDIEYDTANYPYGVKLASIGTNLYKTSGSLESATFDMGSTDINYTKLDWQPHNQPAPTGVDPVLFQIATSNSSTPGYWQFLGPDGTANTYYSISNQNIEQSNNGKRYLRYKLYLYSDDYDSVGGGSGYTPSIAEVDIFYVKSCSIPGQVYFDNISQTSGNTITIEADGYVTNSLLDVTIDSNITTTTDLISI